MKTRFEQFRLGGVLHLKSYGCVYRFVEKPHGWLVMGLYDDTPLALGFETEQEAVEYMIEQLEAIC